MTVSVAELIVKLRDDASAHAAAVAKSLDKIVAAEKAVGTQSAAMKRFTDELQRQQQQLAKVEAVRGMQQKLAELSAAHERARARVRDLGNQIVSAAKVTQQMEKSYEKATRAARDMSSAVESQKFALANADRELATFGASINKIAASEERLKAAVTQTTAAIERQGNAESAAAAKASRAAQRRAAVGGAASTLGFLAGPAILHGTVDAAKAGAHIQSEVVKMGAAGIKQKEVKEALKQSAELQTQFNNVKRESILEMYRETRSVLLHPEETPHMLPHIVNAKSVMDAVDTTGKLSEGLQFAVKGAEVLGIANDPKRFKEYLESFTRAQQVMGKTITPEQQYEFAKYSKSSGISISDRFRSTVGVSLAQEMGGSTTGVSIDQFSKLITGGFQGNNHAAAKQFVALGLANKNDFEKTKTGEIKGMKPGKFVSGAKIAQTDPDTWVYNYLVPAMEKAGAKTENDQISMVRRLFPNQNAAALVNKLIQQRKSFENHAKLYGEAQGLGAVEGNKKDPFVAVKSFTASLESLAGTLTSPIMEGAASKLSEFAASISSWGKSLSEFQEAHPDMSKWIAGGALGAGVAGGAGLTYGLISNLVSGFGLKGSAVALDASAGLLSEAAIALGAKGIPGISPGGKNPGGKPPKGPGAAKKALEWAKNALPFLGEYIPQAAAAIGAATIAYAFGKALKGVGRVASGEYYTPKNDEEAHALRVRQSEIRSQIDGIDARTHPSMRGMPNADRDRLNTELQDIENRLNSINDKGVSPKVDTSSIDAATQKVQGLADSLDRLNARAGAIAASNAGSGSGIRGIHADSGVMGPR